MSSISSVSDTSSPFAPAGATETALGKDDFLILLVAQSQNQDPLNPADATEFTSQLAQFSQLEQLSNMSEKLNSLTLMASQVERQSALGLIGGEVVFRASEFDVNGGSQTLGYRLDAPADQVSLYVLDKTGYNVATLPSTGTDPGEYFIDWDGIGDNGQPVAPGTYSLVARALDEDEKVVDTTSLIRSLVTGIELGDAETSLSTAAGTFSMAKVEKVGLTP